MTKTLARAAVLAAALIASPAFAADLPTKAPAFAAAPFNGYNWNGAYVGVNLGYQWGKVTNWGGGSPDGVAGGGQFGYNWQFGQFVLGGEADVQASARRRHVRRLQVFQSVVRHRARPRRLRDEQRPALPHRRFCLWRRPREFRAD